MEAPVAQKSGSRPADESRTALAWAGGQKHEVLYEAKKTRKSKKPSNEP
jgi:hypothetical protein